FIVIGKGPCSRCCMSSFSFDEGSNELKATIGKFSFEVLTELTALQEEKVMENRVEADKTQCIHAAHVAQAPSGCAHHRFEKATDLLSDEHRVIERVLVALQKLTTKPVEKSLDCWKKVLDFFSHFADQCHHFKEEQVLFPAMEERGIPRDGGSIGMMLMEH